MRLDLPTGLARLLAALARGGRAAVPRRRRGARRAARRCRSRTGTSRSSACRPSGSSRCSAAHGRVDAVGQAFRVYKLSGVEGVRGALDVSLPRRDSKVGPGHRGIAVSGRSARSPSRRPRGAATSRSTRCCSTRPRSELLDPWGGRRDLEARVLRAVDAAHVRRRPAAGAARACSSPHATSCRSTRRRPRSAPSMPLAELPAERVFGEIEKLLLKARRPSLGLALLAGVGHAAGDRSRARSRSQATPQDPDWHPEGDVWTHTLQVVDEAARLLDGTRGRPAAPARRDAGRALPRPRQAGHHALRGRPRPLARPRGGRARARPTSLLDRWNVHTLLGYDVRAQVLALVAQHLKPGQLYDDRERVTDGAIRRLARKCEPDLLYRVARADCLGRRPGRFEPVAMEWFRERVRALDVAHAAARAAAEGPRPAGARPARRGRASGADPAGGLRDAARRRRHDARGRARGSGTPDRKRQRPAEG